MGRDALIHTHNHSTGTSNEYYMAAMYMAEGHQVFWPADQHTAVDFLLERHNAKLKVQVKTVRDCNGYWKCDTVTKHARNSKGSRHYDLLVAVSPNGDVWEIPARLIRGDNLSFGRITGRGRPNKWAQYKIRG